MVSYTYVAVFQKFLSKWPMVFSVANQKVVTLVNLLVEEVVTLMGVPEALLQTKELTYYQHWCLWEWQYRNLTIQLHMPITVSVTVLLSSSTESWKQCWRNKLQLIGSNWISFCQMFCVSVWASIQKQPTWG